MVTYLGTTLGEETSKEFATGVTTVLILPPQDPAILARHAARVLANTTRLEAKILNLEAQQTAIIAALAAAPQDRSILKEKSEVEDDLAKANFNYHHLIVIQILVTGIIQPSILLLDM